MQYIICFNPLMVQRDSGTNMKGENTVLPTFSVYRLRKRMVLTGPIRTLLMMGGGGVLSPGWRTSVRRSMMTLIPTLSTTVSNICPNTLTAERKNILRIKPWP